MLDQSRQLAADWLTYEQLAERLDTAPAQRVAPSKTPRPVAVLDQRAGRQANAQMEMVRLDLDSENKLRLLLASIASFVLTLALFAQPSLAQTRAGWIADPKTGCRVWNATPGPNESIDWTGKCEGNLAHGLGVLQWFKNGRPSDRYEGELRYGKPTGRGVMKTAGGDRYEGDWQDGKASGWGRLDRNGMTISGSWTNGCFRESGRKVAMG